MSKNSVIKINNISIQCYYILWIIVCIYLFLAVLGLYCCSQAFLQLGWVRTTLWLRCTGFLLWRHLLLLSTGSRASSLSSCSSRVQPLQLLGFKAQARFAVHGLSSWARDQTRVSCIGRWILFHWATREAAPQRPHPASCPFCLNKTLAVQTPSLC